MGLKTEREQLAEICLLRNQKNTTEANSFRTKIYKHSSTVEKQAFSLALGLAYSLMLA